jgi:spermidine synthase
MTLPGFIEYFWPQMVELRQSPVNGEISVQKYLGKVSVVVGNLTQSGGLVREIWKKGIEHLNRHHFEGTQPKRLLVMGLGAGSLIGEIARVWPETDITAVELDPVMVQLGKDYFGLDSIKNLEIVVGDAIEWLETNQHGFEVILVDMYLGKETPAALERKKFLELVQSRLTENGMVVFNRLKTNDLKGSTEEFLRKLGDVFNEVHRIGTPANWLLCAH